MTNIDKENTKTKVYIGLDQALDNTGIALYELQIRGRTAVRGKLQYGTFKTNKELSLVERLLEIYDLTWALLEGLKPEYLFTELVYLGRNKSSIDLVRVETVIHLVAKQFEVPAEIMSANPRMATSWPRLFGSGKSKGITQEVIKQATGYYVNEHEGDAIGIGYAGLLSIGICPLPLDKLIVSKLALVEG